MLKKVVTQGLTLMSFVKINDEDRGGKDRLKLKIGEEAFKARE